MAKREAPVGHTCPHIDNVIGEITNAVKILDDLYHSNGPLEELREENAKLREWGNELVEELEEAEKELDEVRRELESANDKIEYLQGLVRELEEELSKSSSM